MTETLPVSPTVETLRAAAVGHASIPHRVRHQHRSPLHDLIDDDTRPSRTLLDAVEALTGTRPDLSDIGPAIRPGIAAARVRAHLNRWGLRQPGVWAARAAHTGHPSTCEPKESR